MLFSVVSTDGIVCCKTLVACKPTKPVDDARQSDGGSLIDQHVLRLGGEPGDGVDDALASAQPAVGVGAAAVVVLVLVVRVDVIVVVPVGKSCR